MIHNSAYWKNDLQRHAQFLSDKLKQRGWRESSFARLEQSIMLGCYSIRKLAEAKKISDSLYNVPISFICFDAKDKAVDFLNWHHIDRFYRTNNPRNIQKELSYIINQIIHSFVFVPIFETRSSIKGIVFNSDRTKATFLYYLDITQLYDIFMKCSGFDVSKITYFRVSETGSLEVVSK